MCEKLQLLVLSFITFFQSLTKLHDITEKWTDLSICHKLWFHNIFATQPLILNFKLKFSEFEIFEVVKV